MAIDTEQKGDRGKDFVAPKIVETGVETGAKTLPELQQEHGAKDERALKEAREHIEMAAEKKPKPQTMAEAKGEAYKRFLAEGLVSSENEIRKGKTIRVNYVEKNRLAPAFGQSFGDTVLVRDDLSPRAKRLVKAHELYHSADTATWGGAFGRELRANIVTIAKDPVGAGAALLANLKELGPRLKFYLDRVKKRY